MLMHSCLPAFGTHMNASAESENGLFSDLWTRGTNVLEYVEFLGELLGRLSDGEGHAHGPSHALHMLCTCPAYPLHTHKLRTPCT